MKIYTSYFGNIRKIKNPVSIALSPPKWYTGPRYDRLAPSWRILNRFKNKSKEDIMLAIRMYEYYYRREVLDRLNANEILYDLRSFYPGEDIVLLCYETPDKFCHRHLVAEWLSESAGIEISEIEKESIYA
jgi:hypothetical protein